MKNSDPKFKQDGGRHSVGRHVSPKDRFNREGADDQRDNRNYDRESSFSGRDRRTRTSKMGFEKVTRESRPDRSREGERHSFNPNFTRDNRLVSSDRRQSSRYDEGNRRNDNERRADSNSRFRRNSGDHNDRWNSGNNRRYGNAVDGENESRQYRKRNNSGYKDGKRQYAAERSKNYPKFAPDALQGSIRLNRFIAQSGLCSRREADDFILAGVVTVNGQVVTELGTKITANDVVRFNDSIVHGEKKVYIVMNKPKGFVTSVDDPHADKTVIDLVKNRCEERVYPVGRLDKNSVGVLLITNDGDLTRQLTHPSYQKKKIYHVTLDKALTKADMQQLADGIELEDGPIAADEISYVGDSKKNVGVEIHSGRNRIVRRMFDALGYSVQKLDRVYFAGLTKQKLKRGAWRFLTPREVEILKSGRYE